MPAPIRQSPPRSVRWSRPATSRACSRARDADGASAFDGCEPIINDVAGRIALVDRGTCNFTVKAQNAQAAGAIGLVVATNTPGPFGPGGADPTITIPVVGVSWEATAMIRAAAQLSGTGDGGVPARIRANTLYRAGTTAGFARLYAPLTFLLGSSVSHFDVTMTPNKLMGPAISRDLPQTLLPPDLTCRLLQDIGW